jgi:murein DD-endopeptidase MepM/ murein hydrolase activator NlpD
MYASRSAIWPQMVAIALMGLGTAGCADSGRFSDFNFDSSVSHSEVTGSIPTSANHVDSKPLPHLASNDGTSGGGRGMGSYQPSGDVTGSVPPTPPPPAWSWEGGTPITVRSGETLQTISRRYGVPKAAILEANKISDPAQVHPGQHLVIPHRRGPAAAALSTPQTRAAAPALEPAAVGSPRAALAPAAGVHVVAPGETLHSISRLYGKSVLAIAKANNIPPEATLKAGERVIIPGAPPAAAAAPAPAAPHGEGSVGSLATADSPHSARFVAPAASDGQQSAVKLAEPAGSLLSFRWPVRGRVIAGFGPKPNGLENDGINLAVPQGTPIKAAEDGVVAYAGNELKGYGNLVLIRHGNGFVTAYAHASELLVKKGDSVKRGQVIAKSGQTGNVTSPQLHFEIRKGATPVDPAQYLKGA